MKATLLHAAGAVALTFTLGACASSVVPDIAVPAPAPTSTPTPTAVTATPPPPPPVVNERRYDDYMDAPETKGTWEYAEFPFGSQAIYNTYDAATTFALSCIKADRQISMTRPILPGSTRSFEIETETTTRTIPASPATGTVPALVARLSPNADVLDAMAITKGRFAIHTPGARSLYIPAWVEFSRVIEDCR